MGELKEGGGREELKEGGRSRREGGGAEGGRGKLREGGGWWREGEAKGGRS